MFGDISKDAQDYTHQLEMKRAAVAARKKRQEIILTTCFEKKLAAIEGIVRCLYQ